MRIGRQNAILKLIKEKDIKTQMELCDELSRAGYSITQATISRDIKELRLLKIQNDKGEFKYAQATGTGQNLVSERLKTILSQALISVDYAMNDVVIKTLSGVAPAAAAAIDAMNWSEVVGSIAGDDTVFMIARSQEAARGICHKLKKMVE